MIFKFTLDLIVANNLKEVAKFHLPSNLKEWLLIIISMRLMWLGLKFLTFITDFFENK